VKAVKCIRADPKVFHEQSVTSSRHPSALLSAASRCDGCGFERWRPRFAQVVLNAVDPERNLALEIRVGAWSRRPVADRVLSVKEPGGAGRQPSANEKTSSTF